MLTKSSWKWLWNPRKSRAAARAGPRRSHAKSAASWPSTPARRAPPLKGPSLDNAVNWNWRLSRRLLSNASARFSVQPDGLFISHRSLGVGRVFCRGLTQRNADKPVNRYDLSAFLCVNPRQWPDSRGAQVRRHGGSRPKAQVAGPGIPEPAARTREMNAQRIIQRKAGLGQACASF